ncbi:MAG TPA: hypothetical protein DCS19_03960, partial [Flavobacterium sp.]|nr:hypothetical protein [Flavobacterium sp.]
MSKIKKLLKNIHSNNVDTSIESIYMIGELKLIEAIEPLIILLQTTNSPKIRNATALALADLGDQKALPFLIAVISDPK